MILVDTNILAYLLIRGDRTKDAQTLYLRDEAWRSEGFILVEFTNILTTYVRTEDLPATEARRLLSEAERIMSAGLVTIPHHQALDLAAQHGVSAYDARFLAAAQSLGIPLVTEDARLRTAAPGLTISLSQAQPDGHST